MPWHTIGSAPFAVSTWTVFGRLPVVCLLALVCWGALRRGASWRVALLATAALVAGLTAGTALLPSVIGALVGGIAAWLVALRVLGARRPPIAELALGVLVVVAVGRLGCLVNGCCFGTPTDLPWSIRYASGSGAWTLHHALGWIDAEASLSRPVHPYPIYETMGLAVWIPAFLILRRRLRSDGAIAALTAAWDLGLRAWIDGYRGMVNVGWSLIGPRYTLMLAFASMALAVLAWRLERRERARIATSAPRIGVGPDLGVLRGWAVYLGVWVLGWVPTVNQTPFLRALLVAAVVAGAGALQLPASVSARGALRRVAIAAASVAVALPVAWQATAFAQAQSDAAVVGWQYEVDHDRGKLVRIGSDSEDEDDIEERRRALGYETAEPPGAARVPGRRGRLWAGVGVGGGDTRYKVSSDKSCSGNYTVHDRRGVNAYAQAEWEEPVSEETVAWIGGRAGYLGESSVVETHRDDTLESTRDLRFRTGFAQAWGEIEHPNYSVGLGVVGYRQSETDAMRGGATQESVRYAGLPGGHLRGGFSFLGADIGYGDRMSMIGFPASHIGVSGAIYDPDAAGQHPDDAIFRYFVGAQTFTGADGTMIRYAPSIGLQLQLGGRHVIGFDGLATEGKSAAALVHYRTVVWE